MNMLNNVNNLNNFSYNTLIQETFVCLFCLLVCPHTPPRCLGACLLQTRWDPGVSLEDLILKGQCRLGHRSNFLEFLGSLWINFPC